MLCYDTDSVMSECFWCEFHRLFVIPDSLLILPAIIADTLRYQFNRSCIRKIDSGSIITAVGMNISSIVYLITDFFISYLIHYLDNQVNILNYRNFTILPAFRTGTDNDIILPILFFQTVSHQSRKFCTSWSCSTTEFYQFLILCFREMRIPFLGSTTSFDVCS